MDKIEILEEKIQAAAKLIQTLRDRNTKAQEDCQRLKDENELLSSENRQVRKLISELDHLREERKLVRQKCEKLLSHYRKLNI